MEATPVPKRSRTKLLLLVALGVFLVLGGGLAYLLLTDDPSEATAPQPAAAKAAAGPVMVLEPFLINLADQESRRYLKVKVELEVDQEKSIKELEKSIPRIRDALILLLGSKSYGELGTTEGKHRLKEEILQRLAQVPGGKKVQNVYFTEFVAQ